MRKWMQWPLISCALLLAACGQTARLKWPTTVASLDGISGDTLSSVSSDIDDLNRLLPSTMVNISSGTGSPIYIKSVSDFGTSTTTQTSSHIDYAYVAKGVQAKDASSTASTQIAGRATLSSKQCVIELGSFLMDSTKKDLLKAVLIHELGHCAGLQHVSDAGEVMSVLTLPFSNYDNTKLSRYVTAFVNSALGK